MQRRNLIFCRKEDGDGDVRLDLRSFVRLSGRGLILGMRDRYSSLNSKCRKKVRRSVNYKILFRRAEVKEEVISYEKYMKDVKKDIPKLNMWEYTLGDKLNIMKNVIKYERKKLQRQYNNDHALLY